MTNTEYQKERMRAWSVFANHALKKADALLVEFDKRFADCVDDYIHTKVNGWAKYAAIDRTGGVTEFENKPEYNEINEWHSHHYNKSAHVDKTNKVPSWHATHIIDLRWIDIGIQSAKLIEVYKERK